MNFKKIHLPSNKVIIHNLTFKGVEDQPRFYNLDQRGVVCSKPGDMIVTHHSLDKDFLCYLESLGWSFDEVNFFYTDCHKSNSLMIFDSKKLTSLVKKSNHSFVDTYQLTDFERLFSKKVKLPLTSKGIDVAKKYGTKSGFRKLANHLDIKILRGKICTRDEGEIILAIESLLAKGVKVVAVKLDEGATGVGITLISGKKYLSLDMAGKMKFIKGAICSFDQLLPESGAVVEEWVENIKVSPACVINVANNTRTEICITYDQILAGKARSYLGSSFPSVINKNLALQIKSISLALARAVQAEGFRGYFGVDFIVFDSKIYPVELNMRKVGTFYPAYILSFLNELNKYFYYISIASPILRGKDFNFVKQQLKPVLYPINHQKEGVIITYIGSLKTMGKITIMCLGDSRQAVDLLLKKINRILPKQTS